MILEKELKKAIERCGYRDMMAAWHSIIAGEKPATDGEYLCLFCYESGEKHFQVVRYYKATKSFNRGIGDQKDLEIYPDFWARISDIFPF